jgi:putative endonuclease
MKKKPKDLLGEKGEQMAVEYLEKLGYEIISRNWKYHPYEIDIIAKHNDFYVIVEVKTRASDDFGPPQDFVSRKKQSHLVKATQLYADLNQIENEFRFDVVAVIINDKKTELLHIPEAFLPLIGM